ELSRRCRRCHSASRPPILEPVRVLAEGSVRLRAGRRAEDAALVTWDLKTDVIVVGFGAAGACAALEAATAGARVLIIDRFGGGGATVLSGGVVYAGGGTPQQQAAGAADSAEAMFAYLRAAAGDV